MYYDNDFTSIFIRYIEQCFVLFFNSPFILIGKSNVQSGAETERLDLLSVESLLKQPQ